MKISPKAISGLFVIFLRVVAVVMVFWVLTGQLSTTPASGPQLAFMAQVDVSDYGNAMSFALPDPIVGLYTDNASAPLNASAGLRRVYKFGLFSHCAFVNETAGLCNKANGLYAFKPYKAITSDMPSNYSNHTNALIHNTTFANSILLRGSSHVARRFFLSGATIALMALISGIVEYTLQHNWMDLFSALVTAVAGLCILVGSAIWTALIKMAGGINSWTITAAHVPIGIHVSAGAGLYCSWTAFCLLVASTFPYVITKIGWWTFSKDGSLYTLQVRVNPDRESRLDRRRKEGVIPLATQGDHV